MAGSAQTPYNPDSDSDNLMGAVDLMSLLSLYGGEFYPVTNEPVVFTIDSLPAGGPPWNVYIADSVDIVVSNVFGEGSYDFSEGSDFTDYAILVNLPEGSDYKEVLICQPEYYYWRLMAEPMVIKSLPNTCFKSIRVNSVWYQQMLIPN